MDVTASLGDMQGDAPDHEAGPSPDGGTDAPEGLGALLPWRLLLFQAVVTAALVAVGVRLIDLGSVLEALREAYLWAAIPALLLFTLAKFIDSFRWRFLLSRVGPPPQRALFGAFLLGNMLNNLLPFRAGDVAKIQVLSNRYGVPRASLATSVFVVEASLDGVTFVIVLVAAMLFWDLAFLEGAARTGLIALTAIAAVAFLVGILLSRHLASVASRIRWAPVQRLAGVFEAMQHGLHALGSWRRTAVAIALSLPAWLVEAAMFWMLGNAFGFDLGYPTYVAVMVAANLAVAVPVTLWNFGAYQALVLAVLVPSGIDHGSALAYALAAQVLTSAWIQVTGLLTFWLMRVRPLELIALSRQGGRSEVGT